MRTVWSHASRAPAFSVKRSLAGTYEAMFLYRRTLPQFNRAALTLSACSLLLRWHFLLWLISRGALVPAWKLEMKPRSNSTNDCRSADWVAFKKREQKLWAFRFTSFPSKRCGCLCWGCGFAEQDLMLHQLLFWGSGTPQPTFMNTNASILEKTGHIQTYSPSVKICFIALRSSYTKRYLHETSAKHIYPRLSLNSLIFALQNHPFW